MIWDTWCSCDVIVMIEYRASSCIPDLESRTTAAHSVPGCIQILQFWKGMILKTLLPYHGAYWYLSRWAQTITFLCQEHVTAYFYCWMLLCISAKWAAQIRIYPSWITHRLYIISRSKWNARLTCCGNLSCPTQYDICSARMFIP